MTFTDTISKSVHDANERRWIKAAGVQVGVDSVDEDRGRAILHATRNGRRAGAECVIDPHGADDPHPDSAVRPGERYIIGAKRLPMLSPEDMILRWLNHEGLNATRRTRTFVAVADGGSLRIDVTTDDSRIYKRRISTIIGDTSFSVDIMADRDDGAHTDIRDAAEGDDRQALWVSDDGEESHYVEDDRRLAVIQKDGSTFTGNPDDPDGDYLYMERIEGRRLDVCAYDCRKQKMFALAGAWSIWVRPSYGDMVFLPDGESIYGKPRILQVDRLTSDYAVSPTVMNQYV